MNSKCKNFVKYLALTHYRRELYKSERRDDKHSNPPDFQCILPVSRFLPKSPKFLYSPKIEVQAIQTRVELSDKCRNGAINLSFVTNSNVLRS